MRGPCQGPWPVAGGLPHPTRARAAPNGLLRGPVLVRNAVPTWAPPPRASSSWGPGPSQAVWEERRKRLSASKDEKHW